jgi:hypothetical protein
MLSLSHWEQHTHTQRLNESPVVCEVYALLYNVCEVYALLYNVCEVYALLYNVCKVYALLYNVCEVYALLYNVCVTAVYDAAPSVPLFGCRISLVSALQLNTLLCLSNIKYTF